MDEEDELKRKYQANYDAVRSAVKKAIDHWDPMGLLETGAPPDEYEFEIDDIVAILRFSTDEKALAEKIQSIMMHSFDDDRFLEHYSRCQTAAREILEGLAAINE